MVPGIEVSDTLKRSARRAAAATDSDPLDLILGTPRARSGDVRISTGTVDRAGMVAVQTPQVFEADVLRAAYAQSNLASTDDSALVEAMFEAEGKGRKVVIAPGDARNIKITRSSDLALVRAVMGLRGPEERPAHKRF